MGTVTNAKQAFAVPFSQTVDLDGEEFDFCPIIQLRDSIFQERSEANDVAMQGGQAALLDRVKLAFWDNKTDLEIIARSRRTSSFPWRKKPSDCGGSFSRLESRIQRTSIGTPNSSISRLLFVCVIEWRPSAPIVRSARTSRWPSGVFTRTPAIRSLSKSRSMTSCCMCRAKVGNRFARLERKSRKSHCGMKAINLQRVGKREKSAMGTA